MARKEEIIIEVSDNGLDQATQKANALSRATKAVADTTSAMAGEMRGASNSVLENGGAMGLLNDATGGYAMMVKDAVEASVLFTKSQRIAAIQQKAYSLAVGASTGAMKIFRLALISTGIGAIVVALGLLIANFDKVKKVVLNLIPGLGAVADVIGGIIQSVTDFIGVTSDASRALDKMVADSEASLKRNEIFLEANGDKFDEYTQRKIKANIEYNKKVKELADDEQFTEEEKIKILQQFREKANREIIKADADREDAIAKKRKEVADKLAEAQKKRDEEAKKRIEEQKRKELEEIERQKKIREDANALEAEIYQSNLDKEVQRELEKQEVMKALRELSDEQQLEEQRKKDLAILEQANATAGEIFEVNRAYDEKSQALSDAKLEADKQRKEDEKQLDRDVASAKVDIASRTLDLVNEIAGEGAEIGKGIAVAQATINGIEGVQAAYTTAQKSPITLGFPAYPAIQAGLAGAFSLLQIKKILSTDSSGKSGVSSGGGSGAGAVPAAPSFNLVQGTGANQIAETLGGQNKPIQAYVVSSNVTTAQSMDRNIVENSKI